MTIESLRRRTHRSHLSRGKPQGGRPARNVGARRRPHRGAIAIGVAAVLALAACGSNAGSGSGAGVSSPLASPSGSASSAHTSSQASGPASAATPSSSASAASGTVRLITHDSFAVDPAVLTAFEKKSGLTVQILAQGDAGAMVSKLIVTKDNPLGDAVFGIDNTLATKAIDADILAPYTSPNAGPGSAHYAIGTTHLLTATDYGDVCVNVDHEYFATHQIPEPKTFEDLAKPQYKDLFVTEDPGTSSPGLAFLFATIAHFGPTGWQQYWKSLKANGVKVDSGWTEAYTVDFSGSSGKGARPLVVSYASSPPDEVKQGDTAAPTGALLDTCFRQVEYAGVLAGAKNAAGAKKVVDFLLSSEFQSQIPAQMYMYPVDSSVTLPASWEKYAPVAPHPETLPPAEITQHRQQWITQWSDLMRG